MLDDNGKSLIFSLIRKEKLKLTNNLKHCLWKNELMINKSVLINTKEILILGELSEIRFEMFK